MPQTLAALVFASEQCVADVGNMLNACNSRVYFNWENPVNVRYIRTDADMLYVVTQYGCAPFDVPVMVLLMRPSVTCSTTEINRLEICFGTLMEIHAVRGEWNHEELRPYADAWERRVQVAETNIVAPAQVIQPETRAQRAVRAAQAIDPERREGSVRRAARASAIERITREQLAAEVQAVHRATSPPADFDFNTLFHPPDRQAAPATFDSSIRTAAENRRVHGRTVTARQREAAAARAAATIERERQRLEDEEAARQSAWVIDWNRIDVWSSPGPDGNTMHVPLTQMEPKHLWDTICWMVTYCADLFMQYNRTPRSDIPIALASKRWLREQPAFRALVQEAVRRRLTFPKDVYRYLLDYVLGRNTEEIQVVVPWADPAAAYQTEELAEFLDAPLVIPREIDAVAEFGREFRDINIE